MSPTPTSSQTHTHGAQIPRRNSPLAGSVISNVISILQQSVGEPARERPEHSSERLSMVLPSGGRVAEVATPAETGRCNCGGHGCLAHGKQRGAAEVAKSCASCYVISKKLPYYGGNEILWGVPGLPPIFRNRSRFPVVLKRPFCDNGRQRWSP